MYFRMGAAVNLAYLLLFIIIGFGIASVLCLLFKKENEITECTISVPLVNLLNSHVPIKTILLRRLNDEKLIDVLAWDGEELFSLSGSDFSEIKVKKYKVSDFGRLTVWSERS